MIFVDSILAAPTEASSIMNFTEKRETRTAMGAKSCERKSRHRLCIVLAQAVPPGD